MNTQKSRFLEKWCHSPPELCCNIQDPQLCAILSILICFTSLEPRSNRVTVLQLAVEGLGDEYESDLLSNEHHLSSSGHKA